jgi:hypothetical protein
VRLKSCVLNRLLGHLRHLSLMALYPGDIGGVTGLINDDEPAR